MHVDKLQLNGLGWFHRRHPRLRVRREYLQTRSACSQTEQSGRAPRQLDWRACQNYTPKNHKFIGDDSSQAIGLTLMPKSYRETREGEGEKSC